MLGAGPTTRKLINIWLTRTYLWFVLLDKDAKPLLVACAKRERSRRLIVTSSALSFFSARVTRCESSLGGSRFAYSYVQIPHSLFPPHGTPPLTPACESRCHRRRRSPSCRHARGTVQT